MCYHINYVAKYYTYSNGKIIIIIIEIQSPTSNPLIASRDQYGVKYALTMNLLPKYDSCNYISRK